jgi:hypothetical protein
MAVGDREIVEKGVSLAMSRRMTSTHQKCRILSEEYELCAAPSGAAALLANLTDINSKVETTS